MATCVDNSVLLFTDAAALKVKALIENENNPLLMLRISISGGGCSGFKYNFSFAELVEADDSIIENQGVKLIIDPISLNYLIGAAIDYKEDINGAQFIISNPNVVKSCSCGSSFCPQ